MALEFEVSDVIPASVEAIYAAWLSSEGHAGMTGSGAEISSAVGGVFTAWEGYITGKNLALEPGKRILQAWRTSEFKDSDPDSTVEVLLAPAPGGSQVTIRHTNLPSDGMQYRQGWIDYYFEPMKVYFSA
jgi:activator of HSP90 ATPase